MKKENHSFDLLIFAFFMLVAFVLYFPILKTGPLWDDWFFIFKAQNLKINNPLVYWGFGSYNRSWPMFYSVLWVITRLFSQNYIFYHLVSLLLHSINTFLIYKILKKLKGVNTELISLLYLVHPLHFFTVAWMIQLKTLLCVFFFLIATIFFLKYNENNTKKNFYLSLVFFAFSLASKAAFAPILVLVLFLKEKRLLWILVFLCVYALTLTLWTTHIKPFKNTYFQGGPVSTTQIDKEINHYIPNQEAAPKKSSSRPLPAPKLKMNYATDRIVLSLKNLSVYFQYLIFPKDNLLVSPRTLISYTLIDLIFTIAVVLSCIFLVTYFYYHKMWYSLGGLVFFLLSLLPLTGIISWPIFIFSNFVEYWLSVPVLGLILCLSQIHFKYLNIALIVIFTFFCAIQTFQSAKTYSSADTMILRSAEFSPENPYIKMVLASHYFFTNRYELSNSVLKELRVQLGYTEKLKKLEQINMKAMRGENVEEFSF